MPAGLPGSGYVTLSDLHFEDGAIRVCMAPREVLLLLAAILAVEITIIPVLLSKIHSKGLVFLAVPLVIVFAAAIIVTPVVLVVPVVGLNCDRSDEGGAQE
jgi:hypothetical protein